MAYFKKAGNNDPPQYLSAQQLLSQLPLFIAIAISMML
ncbi:MAG: hypothetical protein ACI9L9_001447 [Marivirga sp.]|jgi:hypothetical protein